MRHAPIPAWAAWLSGWLFVWLFVWLFAGTAASAQGIVNPGRLRRIVAQLEAGAAGEPALGCEVSAVKPSLNFSFRYQAGYMVTVPMNQYMGSGHVWNTLTRITPEGGDRKPVYLFSHIALPQVPKTNVESRVGGGYLLGEGAYNVRWLMLDDSGRACRKSWRVDVHASRADRKIKVAMPPDTVWEIGLRGSRTLPREIDDAPPLRLTIFLHTAPLFPRRTRMRPNDMVTLMSTVSSLLERVPASAVRLVLFNLDQQKELYRKEGFLLQDMAQVSQAMTNIELGLVDFDVLQNKRGHVDLVTEMVNREMEAQPPSDVVLFLGPAARYFDRVPQASLEKPAEHAPQFYYFQISPFLSQMATPADTIKSAMSRLGGKTLLIHTPGEFAKAIERLEKGGRGAP
jgi:hypothetical protein